MEVHQAGQLDGDDLDFTWPDSGGDVELTVTCGRKEEVCGPAACEGRRAGWAPWCALPRSGVSLVQIAWEARYILHDGKLLNYPHFNFYFQHDPTPLCYT